MQVLSTASLPVNDAAIVRFQSINQAMRSIVAQEGFLGLWRGVPSVIMGAGLVYNVLHFWFLFLFHICFILVLIWFNSIYEFLWLLNFLLIFI